jgi:O-antigen/teichoic acid export membrane protein
MTAAASPPPSAWTTGTWWLLDRVCILGSAALVQVLIARELGPAPLGELSYVLAIVAMGLPLARMGLSGLLVKSLLASPPAHHEILETALAWRLSAVLAVSAVALAWLPLGTTGILALSLFGVALQLTEYSAQAKETPRDVIPARLTIVTIAALGKILVAHETQDPRLVAWIFAAEYATQGLWQWRTYLKLTKTVLAPKAHSTWSRHFSRRTPWLLLASVAEVIYLKVDILMLQHFRSAAEVGTYALAARLSEIWYALPQLAMITLFPRLWRQRETSEIAWRAGLQASMDGLFWIAVLVALATQVLAEPLILWIFGEAFSGSIDVLTLHIWAGIFVFTRALISRFILAEDLIRLAFWSQGSGAVVNITLNWWLIPRYGAMGAAWATLISYAVAGWLVFFLHPTTRWMASSIVRAALLPLRWRDIRKYGAAWSAKRR